MMSLSIQITWLSGDIRSKLSSISKANFKFVELTEHDLVNSTEDGKDLKALLFEYGLKPSILQISSSLKGIDDNLDKKTLRKLDLKFEAAKSVGSNLILLKSTILKENCVDLSSIERVLKYIALRASHYRIRVAYMNVSGSETDMRSAAMAKVFAPMVAGFADYQPGYNATLFAQGTELDAISRGNLTMSIASAQELAQFFPEFSIFATGYVHQDAAHQVRVFNNPLMDSFKKTVEDELGVKLLSVMYLGRRHVNLRQTRDELDVQTPADLAGVNLRMPGTDAWQFLGAALGASPTPFAFTEVYTALSTGAVDGQDNPLPTVVDAKFYEVGVNER